MAVESNFNSLFQNLKLDDPWLPPKPWESIPSESGGNSNSKPSTSNSPHQLPYDPSTVSEINLVRLVINALQGVESTLHSIEKLSESFCSSPADRTSHRTPSLWYRSSSTNALGKILKSVGSSGFVAFLLRKFVDYFLCMESNVDGRSREEGIERKQVDTEVAETQTVEENETTVNHEYSLVNQAFAVAVGKVLEGYICALDTLYASVQMRRSVKKVDVSAHVSSGAGCLTSVVHSEITLLEVYLHTKELRTHIEALGNICFLEHVGLAFSTSSLDDLTVEATIEFTKFPRGANLLTYLYTQLRDADPVHHALFKFLFVRSCQPYCGFIKSWIYQAKINDPYKEFIVEHVEDSTPYSHARDGFLLASIKERNGVAVPCFLRSFSLPLLRAGQQLQVLIKLLELCSWMYPGHQMSKDILPCWSGASSDHLYNLSPLTFSKRSIEEMEVARENMYQLMQERLQIHFTNLDTKYQQISRNVSPFGTVPLFANDSRGVMEIPDLYTFEENLPSPSSTAEKGELNLDAATLDSDASSATDEFSYEVDPWESSECSSLDSASELNEFEKPTEPHENSIEMELKSLTSSGLFTNIYKVGHVLPEPLQSEKLHTLKGACNKRVGGMDSNGHYEDGHHKETKLSHISEHFPSTDATRSSLSETQYVDYQSMTCWPLGGLLKNPFYLDGGYRGETQSQLTNCRLVVHDTDTDILRVGLSYNREACASNISLPNHAREDIHLGNGIRASSESFLPPSWNLKYNCNLFNMNPMLTKYAWHTMDESRGRGCMGSKQSSFPYFSFSTMENPLKVFQERLRSLDQGSQVAFPLFDNSAVRMDEDVKEQGHDGDDIPVGQKSMSCADSSLTFCENQQEDNIPGSASGGAKWEHSLNYSGINVVHTTRDNRHCSESTSDIPLDVVIDRCILQEILLQYKYVSSFTIKLLEEGFDLREHFLALRRYHFMEFADWADLFIMSLWRHKWYAAEGNKRISEIQGFLDMAVQRSSCEGDPYKERLFVYMKGDGMMPLPTSTFGVHAFDFIALGFRVDWPVSIVLTPGAVKIYSEIFSFLIRVKLAVFSLTDVWCLLKDLVHLFRPNHNSGFDERDKTYFNFLMKMRYQVNHFVSTLQQYVLSQLSHVSWSRFLHSLKHQVKDMLDLESIHMAYLADSLHICFLSAEMQQVAGIIENILQSALDFRSCVTVGGCEVFSDQKDSSRLLDRLNFAQVLTIKESFEKNLKELYLCYLKSPKHRKYGLSHFWEYLNYNDYYSNVIGNGISLYTF